MNNIAPELIKWAFAHPFLASLLGISIVGGVTAVGVVVVNNFGSVAGKMVDKGTNISYANDKFGISLNQPLPPRESAQNQRLPQKTSASTAVQPV